MEHLKVDNGSSILKQAEEEDNTTGGPAVLPSPNAAGLEGMNDLDEKFDDGINREELTDFYQDILQPLADLDPFASTVIM